MFRDRDLILRLAAALVPPEIGYAWTQSGATRSDSARFEWISARVAREAARLLGDPERGKVAGAGFAAAIACDDLDAITALLWPRSLRRLWTQVEGDEYLPAAGPVVLVSFHVSGGLRVFDVLIERGFRPTFVLAEDRPTQRRYVRFFERLRRAYFARRLQPPYVAAGRGARRRLEAHLAGGGAVVGLLDVPPEELGLRDHAPAELFGRSLRLPVGLLRLALAARAPVIPFDGRVERGRRVIRFHPPAAGKEPTEVLRAVLRTFEAVIREHPETWQAWLDLDGLFGEEAPAAPAQAEA